MHVLQTVQAQNDKADQMRSSTRQKKQETGKKNALTELRAAQERKTTQAKCVQLTGPQFLLELLDQQQC